MPVSYAVDSLEGIDESLKSFYVEKDGKFVLDVEGTDNLTREAVSTATRRANKEAETERLKRKELEAKVSKWEALGKSDEEIAELIARTSESESKDAEKKGDVERIKQQMLDLHTKELKKRDTAIESANNLAAAMRQQLENHLIDANATAAIAANKGVPELLLPHVRKRVKVVEEDGSFKVQVLEPNGEPAYNGKGEPLSISEMVEGMRSSDIFGRAFESSGAMGSGTPPGTTGATGKGGYKRRSDFKSERERAAYVDQYSLEAYNALPA